MCNKEYGISGFCKDDMHTSCFSELVLKAEEVRLICTCECHEVKNELV